MGRRSVFQLRIPPYLMTVLMPVYTDTELDDVEKEVAPLAQDLPTTVLAPIYTDAELDDIEKVAPLA